MKKIFFVLIFLFMLAPCLVRAEVLEISSADMTQVALLNCQAQGTQLNAIVNAFLKKTRCKIKGGQIICPDEKVEDEKPTP